MIRSAPASSLPASRSISRSRSAAVGSSAQAMVKPAGAPMGLPAWSSPRLRRRRMPMSPVESVSQTPVPVGWSPMRGGSPVSARMSRTPSACAPRSSDSSAIRFRSRVVTWTTHSRSRSCWMPNATAIAPMRTRAIALSLMFTASTPAAWRTPRRLQRPLQAHGARWIDLDADHEAAGGQGLRQAGGWRRRRAPRAPTPAAAGGRHGRPGAPRLADGSRRPGRAMPSSAARMAAMCSGVVPQQPPIEPRPRLQEARHLRCRGTPGPRHRRSGPRRAPATRRWA